MPRRASTAARSSGADPTVYPTEHKMGEESLQRFIITDLLPLLARWLREQGVKAFVGADQFFYWRQHDPLARIAPDLFVLPGVEPATRIRSWKVWEHGGVVPSFALEVVSQNWQKDYEEAPDQYAELGVGELVVFDPDWESRDEGMRWQLFRRVRGRALRRVQVTFDDEVHSSALRCFLRAVGRDESTRVRIATGPEGAVLVPTDAELVVRDRAEKERERAEKQAALRRVAELEAELRRRR
jgi:Uma2 family endonuclease